MTTPRNELNFHLWMAVLLCTALFAERPMRDVFPGWNPPTIGLVAFALGLVWVAGFALQRLRVMDERLRELEARLRRERERVDELEREADERRAALRSLGHGR